MNIRAGARLEGLAAAMSAYEKDEGYVILSSPFASSCLTLRPLATHCIAVVRAIAPSHIRVTGIVPGALAKAHGLYGVHSLKDYE